MMISEIISVKSLMKDFHREWAICGGWAIDLFSGRVTREQSSHVEDEGSQHDFDICFPKLAKNQQQWLMDNQRKLYGDEYQWLK